MAVAMQAVRDVLQEGADLPLYCDLIEDRIVVGVDGFLHIVVTRADIVDGSWKEKFKERLRIITDEVQKVA